MVQHLPHSKHYLRFAGNWPKCQNRANLAIGLYHAYRRYLDPPTGLCPRHHHRVRCGGLDAA